MPAPQMDGTFDVQITREAGELFAMAQMGHGVDSFIVKDLSELNAKYSSDHKALAAIQKQYRFMSNDDPLFINEVQIGKDGSLEFSANKVTSPELEKIQLQFAVDFMKRQKDKEDPNKPSLKDDDRALQVDSAAMQKIEKNIVAHKQG